MITVSEFADSMMEAVLVTMPPDAATKPCESIDIDRMIHSVCSHLAACSRGPRTSFVRTMTGHALDGWEHVRGDVEEIDDCGHEEGE